MARRAVQQTLIIGSSTRAAQGSRPPATTVAACSRHRAASAAKVARSRVASSVRNDSRLCRTPIPIENALAVGCEDDVPAVRRPDRKVIHGRIGRPSSRHIAFHVHDPDVMLPTFLAADGDPAAVGRELWVLVRTGTGHQSHAVALSIEPRVSRRQSCHGSHADLTFSTTRTASATRRPAFSSTSSVTAWSGRWEWHGRDVVRVL